MKTKIIIGIAPQTATNKPLKRAFEFYFKLKMLNTDGYFTSNKYAAAATELNISLPTFYNRMMLCKNAGLINNTKKQFTLISYDKACELYNTEKKYFYTSHSDIQMVLDCQAIRLKQKAKEKAFFSKLKKYPAIAETLKQITGLETSNAGFREAVLSSLILDHVKFSEAYNKDLNALNPDINLNYASLSTMFAYKGRGSAAYKKRKIAKSNIANIIQRQYSINPHRYSSLIGNICYFRPIKQRVLTLPDSISFANF